MSAPDLYVVATPFKHGRRDYLSGDRYDRSALQPAVDDEFDRRMKVTKWAVPLTRETYAIGMARRPPLTIGHGFTAAMLVEHQIITQAEADALAPERDAYKGYLIEHILIAPFTWYQVTDAAGAPMRVKKFRTRQMACEFIDGLPEITDDGDIRSEPIERS